MAGKGGYQAPAKPAVSAYGPGGKTQRTDGGPASQQTARYIAGGDYGDGGLMDIQTAAPMAATPEVQAAPASPQDGQAASMGVPLPDLSGMSQRPWEHETTPHVMPAQPDPRTAELNSLITRYMPDFQAATRMAGAPDSWKNFVNYLANQVKSGGSSEGQA